MGLLRARLRAVAVKIDLAPRVALDPASQRAVQRAVEDRGVEIGYCDRKLEAVEFGKRHPNSREALTVRVEPQELSIEEAFPRATLGPLVQEMDEIVRATLDVLRPSVLAAVHVVVRKQVAAPGGDARVYLGERVLGLTTDKRKPFGRPIHMVGLTLFMPPFNIGDGEGNVAAGERDSVEVRIESLNEDTADLYVECTCVFPEPMVPSDLESLGPLVHRTDDFINEHVAAFLAIPALEEGASDD